jgi:hypothetical protein
MASRPARPIQRIYERNEIPGAGENPFPVRNLTAIGSCGDQPSLGIRLGSNDRGSQLTPICVELKKACWIESNAFTPLEMQHNSHK